MKDKEIEDIVFKEIYSELRQTYDYQDKENYIKPKKVWRALRKVIRRTLEESKKR